MKKIVMVISGGNVDGIFSNASNIEVEIIDFDNLKAEGKTGEQREKIFLEATKGMTVLK